MLPVPRVQYADAGFEPVELGGDRLGHPRRGMANNHQVGPHRQVGFRRIEDGFTIGERRTAGGKIEQICRQALRR